MTKFAVYIYRRSDGPPQWFVAPALSKLWADAVRPTERRVGPFYDSAEAASRAIEKGHG